MQVLAFVPDLLFGSTVHAALIGAGHQVELVSELDAEAAADVLVVDLTAEASARIDAARPVLARGIPGLAFYAHVEAEVRELAGQAGFALVVPRSRMAREAAELVARLGSNIA